MYRIIGNKRIKLILFSICGLTALGLLINICFFSPFSAVFNQEKGSVSKPVIIVDAGHGGVDGGAVGDNNVLEKDLNLDISLTVRDMLTLSGFEVVMTRTDDRSIHDDSAKSIRNKKKSDLHNRAGIIESHPGALTVSIHQNIFPESQYNGAHIFYSKNNPESKEFALIMQNCFKEMIQPNNERVPQEAGKNIYLMWNTQNPALLVECGFLSNPEELRKLNTKEYRNKVAFVITSGILKYINQNSQM